MRESEEAGSSSCSWRTMESAARGEGEKRRFSEEQIKSLESIFQAQSKLEPRQKLALAGELGLQPRQVAIWFQNKRARWKSKQLEREYAALRADYDALLASFEALKEENQMLAKQLEKLAEAMQLPQGREEFYADDMKRVAMYAEEEEEMKKKLVFLSEEEAERYGVGRGSSSLTSLEEQQQLCFNTAWVSSDDQMCTSSQCQWWPHNEL